eukprot:5363057-Pleurochrysis_carterae.AAC.2
MQPQNVREPRSNKNDAGKGPRRQKCARRRKRPKNEPRTCAVARAAGQAGEPDGAEEEAARGSERARAVLPLLTRRGGSTCSACEGSVRPARTCSALAPSISPTACCCCRAALALPLHSPAETALVGGRGGSTKP